MRNLTAGDTVTYHDGERNINGQLVVRTVDAIVDVVYPDGSLALRYPHPADASVMATADRVLEGAGGYQFSRKETH